jgi:hypothetical protein
VNDNVLLALEIPSASDVRDDLFGDHYPKHSTVKQSPCNAHVDVVSMIGFHQYGLSEPLSHWKVEKKLQNLPD